MRVLALLLLAVAACGGEEAAPPEALFRSWRRSVEEDAQGVQVYRPSEYRFPPSRGREGLELGRDGSVVELRIAPTDGLVRRPGRWRWEPPDRLVIELADEQAQASVLVVREVDGERLVVAR